MCAPKPGTRAWLAQIQEETVDPGRRIVDPHHHLWRRPTGNYLLEDLWGDTEAVGSDGETHNIEKTVFVECRACYREDGPEHLRCIGETEFVAEIAEIAECPNVVAKIGGLAMPDNGFGWNERAVPAASDELVAAQRRYRLHTIECFGPDRCMFESNFPVDKLSIHYHVLYNALKKIAAGFSDDEQDAMFYRTAARVYSL